MEPFHNTFIKTLHSFCWTARHLRGVLTPPEFPLLAKHLKANSSSIDIGAHGGAWTYALSKASPAGKVFAFEALPYYSEVLAMTLRNLRIKNTRLANLAIGSSDASASVVFRDRHGRHLTGRTHVANAQEQAREAVSVTLRSIDSLDSDGYFGDASVDIIKCDIEGGELAAILGAERFLKKHRPLLYIEIEEEHCTRYGHTRTDVFSKLSQFGYRPASALDINILNPRPAPPSHSSDTLFVHVSKMPLGKNLTS